MKIIAPLVCFCLAGCASTYVPAYPIQTPYRAEDFSAWTGPGQATIKGQAFLKTVGGDVKTCAGATVTLLPATAYNDEIFAAQKTYPGRDLTNIYGEADTFNWKSTCDAQGNFEFRNVPVRAWWIKTRVEWGIPMGYSTSWQGGDLASRVNLRPGENTVYLTGKDEIR